VNCRYLPRVGAIDPNRPLPAGTRMAYRNRHQAWLPCNARRVTSILLMKVEVEKQPDSVSTLQIELAPEQVTKEWNAIADNFARYAKIPGYRPGKAPRKVIEAKFKKEIQEELTKKLVSKSYRDAVAEKKLRVVSLTNVEDVEIRDDKTMRFRATVITAPEFDLPDYKNITVQLPPLEVTEEEIDAGMERLREQAADFVEVEPERPLQMDDFAVIDFEGTIEGQPIRELAPEASKNLQGGKKFWLHLASENFLPKFCEQLIGQKKDETRLVIVDFPADLPVKELAGKKADYAVTLREIKQKVLPELNDAFATKVAKDKTLAELRKLVVHDLEHEKEHAIERAKESQIIKALQDQTQFDLPPQLLRTETRRALGELVQQNRQRGVPDEMLKSKEKELVQGAGSLAAHRLKTNFILHRIAEEEKIQVTSEEVEERIRKQAARYNVSVEKMRKEIDQREGINSLVEEILLGKTIDFLEANVSVKTTADGDKQGKNS
jgi:trigger factor